MASFSGYISHSIQNSLLRRQSNNDNSAPGQAIATSTPNGITVASSMPIESLTCSPISTTGSASVLDWNSNSDNEFLELDAPQVAGPTEVDDSALQPQSEEGQSSTAGAQEAVNTITTTTRRVSLEEIAVYQFDSFPSSPSSLSASLSPAASAPLNVLSERPDAGIVNDLSSDTILVEEVEQPRQITEKDVGEAAGIHSLQEDEAYHAPLTMSVVAQTAKPQSAQEVVQLWKATLSSDSEEPISTQAESIHTSVVERLSPVSSEPSCSGGDDLEEQPSMATVTQKQVHQIQAESFTCSLFEPPSKSASPSGSRLSYMSEPMIPSIMAGPSSTIPFFPPMPSNPWFRELEGSLPLATDSPRPATIVNPYDSPRSPAYPPPHGSDSPYRIIPTLGCVDTPRSFFSPLLPPAQLESPRSTHSPPLVSENTPSNSNSPPRTYSVTSEDSPRSFLSPPLPYISTDSPRSIISPPMPLPPTPPVERRRSPDFYAYPTAPIPSFPNMLHRVYGRFSPEDEDSTGAMRIGPGSPDQALPKGFARPALVRSMTEIPSWLKASDEEKSQGNDNLPSRPMFLNTSSSSTLASSSKPRPPLPPLPRNTLPHGSNGPEASLPVWGMGSAFTFGLSRLPSPPTREHSSDTMRSVPLLSPPGGYATLPGGITTSHETARVYSYSPSPSLSPPPSENSTVERQSVYGSPTPLPAPQGTGVDNHQPTFHCGVSAGCGSGSFGSLTGPPPSAQRRLRFAPLPPTPGSSLRASVFTPSPYPIAHAPIHSHGYHAAVHPPPVQVQGGAGCNGLPGLATATYAGGGGHHQPQVSNNGAPYPTATAPTNRLQSLYPHPPNYGSFSFPNQCPYRQPIPSNQSYNHHHPPSSAPATSGNFLPSFRLGSDHSNTTTGRPQPLPPLPFNSRSQLQDGDMQRQLNLLQQVANGVPPPLAGRAPMPQVPTQGPLCALPASLPPVQAAQTQTASRLNPWTPPESWQVPFAPQLPTLSTQKPGLASSSFTAPSQPPAQTSHARTSTCMLCSMYGKTTCSCQNPTTMKSPVTLPPLLPQPTVVSQNCQPMPTGNAGATESTAPTSNNQPVSASTTITPVSAPMQPGVMRFTSVAPHPSFWFPDGTVVFEVENTLFKVHKFFFLRHSEFFRTLFGSRPAVSPPSLPQFKFIDVKKMDFERLLYVFYPTSLTSSNLTTVEDWTSILTLAHKWQIPELKSLAVQKLGPLAAPIDKIALARNFNLSNFTTDTVNVKQDWLVPAYTDLCSRNAPLTLPQAEKLDMPTVVKIWEVQHEILNWPGAYYGPQIMGLVKGKFGLE